MSSVSFESVRKVFGKTVALAGTDVGRLGEDGRLHSITGFFGDLPAA